MRITIMILSALFLFSCRAYVPQPPKIKKADLPSECGEAYEVVKENWVKHRESPCHKRFNRIDTFAKVYEGCLLKLDRQEVEKLFGNPDEVDAGNYSYIFREYCPGTAMAEAVYFHLVFQDDQVIKIDAWLKDGIE